MTDQKIKILLCEDDRSLALILADYLRSHEYIVDIAVDGKDGQDKFLSNHYDFLLLDVNMPIMNGYDMLKDIRKLNSDIPAFYITGRTSKEDMMYGYECGCDDYITKPFSMDILLCKIHAMARRMSASHENTDTVFDLGNGYVFDSVHQSLNDIHLSGRESDLMLILCRYMNQMVERSTILRTIWNNDDFFASRSLSVYINHIRKHLTGTGVTILSVHGKGYKMVQNVNR